MCVIVTVLYIHGPEEGDEGLDLEVQTAANLLA